MKLMNISFDEMKKIVGDDTANKLRDTSRRVHKKAREMAEKKGIIIADTKMEFGIYQDAGCKQSEREVDSD
ncbi:MAG: phosphoribosylaminoimidazolesuccinocarboxamide synthase [Nitrospirota bacterium]